MKKALTKKKWEKIFDPENELTPTTDANNHAEAGAISHEGQPVMYLSRKLTAAETNCWNIEKKVLVIVWSMERKRNFLLLKPLEFLFYPRIELSKVISSRMWKWVIKLMAFDFDIMYVKRSLIPHADAQSKLEFCNETIENHEKAQI